MRPALPWLCQGDIFKSVPVPVVEADATGQLCVTYDSRGPALLITHDCTLDKTNRALEVKVRRLFFLPLVALSVASRDQEAALRRNQVFPAESLFLPGAGEFGDCFVVLSSAYYLPADLFNLRLTKFEHPEAEDAHHLEAMANGDRPCRLDADALDLFRQKWSVFWTRLLPDSVPLPQPTRPSVRRVVASYGASVGRGVRRLLALRFERSSEEPRHALRHLGT